MVYRSLGFDFDTHQLTSLLITTATAVCAHTYDFGFPAFGIEGTSWCLHNFVNEVGNRSYDYEQEVMNAAGDGYGRWNRFHVWNE